MPTRSCELGHPVSGDAEYCPVCMSTNLRFSGGARPRPAAVAEPDPVWTGKRRIANARSLLLSFLVWGAVVYVAGSVIGVLNTRGDADPGAFWELLGTLTAASGGCMLAISVIGFGVKFGREAADVAPPPS